MYIYIYIYAIMKTMCSPGVNEHSVCRGSLMTTHIYIYVCILTKRESMKDCK